ncbi:MAG: HAMP domain-containing sensor histidine kinase [Bacteroidota bacterium]
MRIQRNRLAECLMVGSLLLLLFFEGFWLDKVYDDSKRGLRWDSRRAFFGAIRSVEDSLMRDMFEAPMEEILAEKGINLRDSARKAYRVLTQRYFDEPGFRMEPARGRGRNRTMPDSLDRIGQITFFRRQMNSPDMGSLALSFNLTEGNHQVVLGLENPMREKVKEVLQAYFHYELSEQEMSVPDFMLQLDTSPPERGENLWVHTYADLSAQTYYSLYFPSVGGYVLREIWPQVLFAFFLFGSIALAFWVTFRNMQAQRRLAEVKNDFISNVTHELKTPITTVGVAIEALSSFQVLHNPERTQEYLDISKQELNRLSLLVDRVLKMSLFESSEPDLKIENLDLQQLTERILNTMKLQFEKHSAKVSLHLKGETYWVQGDRTHLTSLIYNLIDNALKYSPVYPEIDLYLEEKKEGLQLSVQDKGMGIPPEYQKRIFDKFFRIPTGDRHNIKGHGLGLSYVASVVQQHQGQIRVESALDQGTTFIINLPKQHG